MTEFEEKIFEQIQKANGIKGSEIARILGETSSDVNSTLYNSKELKKVVWKGQDYKWYVKQPEGFVTKQEISKPSDLVNQRVYILRSAESCAQK